MLCYDANVKYLWSFILFLLVVAPGEVVAADRFGSPEPDTPTHLNFFRSALRGRQRVLSCADDPRVCVDRGKNPWGGSTCCFRKFCKDTLRDSDNCGACGQTCAYGFVCCDGKCVDIRNDPRHCGSCFQECPGQGRCSFAMCDYSGWIMLINKFLEITVSLTPVFFLMALPWAHKPKVGHYWVGLIRSVVVMVVF